MTLKNQPYENSTLFYFSLFFVFILQRTSRRRYSRSICRDPMWGDAINHTGDDVYAYDASGLFGTQAIQAGGHTNGSTTDIGVNIFNGINRVSTGDYTINDGGGDPKTAYIFFQPTRESGYEFISQNNQGVVRVINCTYSRDNPEQLIHLRLEFDNVVMTNFNSGQDTCISSYMLDVRN